MPFKSKAQRRKFAELLVKGEISPETFEEWNRETGRVKLPERVKPAKKRSSKRKAKSTVAASKSKARSKRSSKRGSRTRRSFHEKGSLSRPPWWPGRPELTDALPSALIKGSTPLPVHVAIRPWVLRSDARSLTTPAAAAVTGSGG
jgi:hypothetical protein